MANLVYYGKERIEFKEAFERKMSIEEAEIIFEKLCRHFKLNDRYNKVHLYWTSGSRCPKAIGRYAIKLNQDCNDIGRLCHELAHTYTYKKYGRMGHNKRHWRSMRTMIVYCKRRNYWQEEIKKRLTPRPQKPIPTKNELKLKVIERLENNCHRYKVKIRMYGNKLKKSEKKILRLNKLLEQ